MSTRERPNRSCQNPPNSTSSTRPPRRWRLRSAFRDAPSRARRTKPHQHMQKATSSPQRQKTVKVLSMQHPNRNRPAKRWIPAFRRSPRPRHGWPRYASPPDAASVRRTAARICPTVPPSRYPTSRDSSRPPVATRSRAAVRANRRPWFGFGSQGRERHLCPVRTQTNAKPRRTHSSNRRARKWPRRSCWGKSKTFDRKTTTSRWADARNVYYGTTTVFLK